MRTRRLGSLEVSVVGLGGNNFGTDFFGARCQQDDVSRIVNAALDAGVNFIDTAEEYSITSFIGVGRSEEFLGVALASRRDEAIIATKFQNHTERDPGERGAARIVRAAEDSLRRLGTDRIDLYQQHFPDPEVPIEEILEALDQLVRQGKVREIGCCNFSGEMITRARAAADDRSLARFVSCQSHYNLLEHPDPAVLSACEQHGMGVIPYFPLASGLLTGKYRRGEPPPSDSRLGADGMVSGMLRQGALSAVPPLSDPSFDTLDRLEAFARERGRSLHELAIAWLTSQAVVASVIAGATKPEQVVANAAAAAWELTPDEIDAVAAISAA